MKKNHQKRRLFYLNYQRSNHSIFAKSELGKYLLIFILTFASIPSYSQTPNQLYQKGQNAYYTDDYVNAHKFFYAYTIIMGNQIPNIVKEPVDYAIKHCEYELRTAMNIKKKATNGQTVRTTFDTEGKMDSGTNVDTNIKKAQFPQVHSNYNPLKQVNNNVNSKLVTNLRRDLNGLNKEVKKLKNLNLKLEEKNKNNAVQRKRLSKAYYELKRKCGVN